MRNLIGANDSLELVTSAAAALTGIFDWSDTDVPMTTASNVTPGNSTVNISTATTTTVVTNPGVNKVRNIKGGWLRNKDAALSDDVTIRHNANGTILELFKCTLLVGEVLVVAEGVPYHFDANGGLYGAQTASHELNNFSTGSQAPTAATLTQIVGSSIAVPTGKLKIGTIYECVFNMTKTAAGTATSTFAIRIGTANSTADASICAFTKPAGTAAADEATVTIRVVIRGPLTASCIASGHFVMTHNLSATGHAVIPCVDVDTVSSGFDATVAGLFISVSITSGASDAITIQNVITKTYNLQP